MSAEYELPDPDEVLMMAEAIIADEDIRHINECAAEYEFELLINGMSRKLERAEKRRERRQRFGAWITENLIEIGNCMPPIAGLKTAYKMVSGKRPGDAEPGTVQ